MLPTPDPLKHCVCIGERIFRYRTDHKGRTRLVCELCKKPQPERTVFQAERVPA